jgi:hypothetical protein
VGPESPWEAVKRKLPALAGNRKADRSTYSQSIHWRPYPVSYIPSSVFKINKNYVNLSEIGGRGIGYT